MSTKTYPYRVVTLKGKTGWKADIFAGGWTTVYDENGKVLSMHLERQPTQDGVVGAYVADGWTITEDTVFLGRDRQAKYLREDFPNLPQ